MCGIAGFVLDRRKRTEPELESIREDFATLMAATEIRGRDAAGAFVFTPGRTTCYYKQPGPASRMVAQPTFWALLDTITEETVGVVGHARWATQGSPKNNANNHPLVAGPIIGVHNGVVANYQELVQQVGATAQVDSEVIFRLL
jgi:glucosamine 6-phosphate synthetase-like amidotransferase/phosphosugar isomerase protein